MNSVLCVDISPWRTPNFGVFASVAPEVRGFCGGPGQWRANAAADCDLGAFFEAASICRTPEVVTASSSVRGT